MKIQWPQVFVFPLRRPSILVKLWLLHLLPFVALIPLLISGSLTAVGTLIAAHERAFMGPLAALGAGTMLAYLFFVTCAMITGLYPIGYLRDTVREVASGDCKAPLPMKNWPRRCLTGFYQLLLVYPVLILATLPAGLAVTLVAWLGGPALLKAVGSSGWLSLLTSVTLLATYVFTLGLFLVLLTGTFLRLSQTLNPLRALNPVAIFRDLVRGWKDYLILNLICLALYFFLVTVSTVVVLALPFMVSGPLLLVPGVLLGLFQNYLLLAAGQASGQYVRHYCR